MEPKESQSRTHFAVSMGKSGIRIVACLVLVGAGIAGIDVKFGVGLAGVLLLLAELLGIIEEF